jgi:hypothetical protein
MLLFFLHVFLSYVRNVSSLPCISAQLPAHRLKLEKEELARTNAFQARMDALARFSNSYESRVGARLQQQKEENDRQINANLAEADRKALEREKADYERRRQTALRNTEYNITMMERKKQAQEQERLDALERRRRMEEDAQEAKRRDQVEAEQKRAHMMELKQNLDLQVTQRETGVRNFAALSNIEATMNKVWLYSFTDLHTIFCVFFIAVWFF